MLLIASYGRKEGNMDENDQAVEKTALIIKALQYARDNNLNIYMKEDVRNILQHFDPEHISDAETEEFMMLLHATYSHMKNAAIDKKDSHVN